MGTFIVKTEESVTGTYLVEAEDEKQARERFNEDSGKLDWDHVEQTDYMAYTCEVQSVEALEYPQRPAGFRVGFPLSGAKRSGGLWDSDADTLRLIPDPDVDERTGH